jgi:hypothetical protein
MYEVGKSSAADLYPEKATAMETALDVIEGCLQMKK